MDVKKAGYTSQVRSPFVARRAAKKVLTFSKLASTRSLTSRSRGLLDRRAKIKKFQIAAVPAVKIKSPINRSTIATFLGDRRMMRSEEHTSELQSLRHLVSRLLLEKKK